MLNLVSEGTVTITGKDSKGQEIVVEAPIKDLEIKVENEWEHVPTDYYLSSARLFNERSETTFSMKVGGTGQYTIKTKPAPKGVERTARVHVRDVPEGAEIPRMTIKDIRTAADKAGVDENTPFLERGERDIRTNTLKQFIEFGWTD